MYVGAPLFFQGILFLFIIKNLKSMTQSLKNPFAPTLSLAAFVIPTKILLP